MAQYARPNLYARGPAPCITYGPDSKQAKAINKIARKKKEVLPALPALPHAEVPFDELTKEQKLQRLAAIKAEGPRYLTREQLQAQVAALRSKTAKLFYVVQTTLAHKMEGSDTPRVRRLKKGSCWGVFASYTAAEQFKSDRKLGLCAEIVEQ